MVGDLNLMFKIYRDGEIFWSPHLPWPQIQPHTKKLKKSLAVGGM